MEHNWEIELVEYYDMDSDWVCSQCQARLRREFQHGRGGTTLSTRETFEEFQARLKSPWEAWRKISEQCPGKKLAVLFDQPVDSGSNIS